MSEIEALIARLKVATEGSRELDADIAEVLGWEPSAGVGYYLWFGAEGHRHAVPHPFTTSLDAALTLVPEGWRSGFEEAGAPDANQNCEAWVWPYEVWWEPDWRNGDEGYRSHPNGCRAVGTTPALALCIAALRARASHA